MQNKSTVVGITGGIGSGKTTVCKVFETLGAETYYADDRAKWLMQNDEGLIQGLKELFGLSVFQDGVLDRKLIASKVFQDNNLLELLNALVHPVVRADLEHWEKQREGSSLLLKEAALLFETGSYQSLRKTILVTAPEQTRLERVAKRDSHRSIDEIRAIMQKQMPDDKKSSLADFIIVNDGSKSVLKQIEAIYDQLVVT